MAMKTRRTYAAPTRLKPRVKGEDGVVHVVVETPKGSRNKLKFDDKLGAFILKKVLPDGMIFPTTSASCPRPGPKTAIRSTCSS